MMSSMQQQLPKCNLLTEHALQPAVDGHVQHLKEVGRPSAHAMHLCRTIFKCRTATVAPCICI
jgi:hypothetical protein